MFWRYTNARWSDASYGDLFALQNVTQKNADVSPLGNDSVRCTESPVGVTVKARVLRFMTDLQAVTRFASEEGHRGQVAAPMISAQAINDATVFAEGQHTLRQRMKAAGNTKGLCSYL